MSVIVPPLRIRPPGSADLDMRRGATISACGNYRYHLWREWRGTGKLENYYLWTEDDGSPALDGAGVQLAEAKACVFVMLNPSTADGEQDDRTVRRCIRFAKAWGFDRLEIVNLFAWRSTDPKEMLAMTSKGDPVGHRNRSYVHQAVENAGLVVCAWGANGGHIDQDETVLGWIEEYDGEPHALRLTKAGHPEHPLYLPGDLKPFRWNGRRVA